MKIIAYLVILVLMIILVIFDVKNLSVSTSYFMFNDTYHNAILPMIVTVWFLFGIIAGAMYGVINAINSKKMSNAQNRRVEKISIDKDSADLKIHTLEEKIKTLEAALDKALKK